MATYLRFQTGVRDADACYGLGVFSAVGSLEDNGMIEQHLEDTLNDVLHWFNRNLQVPRIAVDDRTCLFWFRTDHQHFISRLWDLVAILRDHDVVVRKYRTSDPGMIVYRDDYQIAAIPNRRVQHALRV